MKQILLLLIVLAFFLLSALAQTDATPSDKIDPSPKCRIFGINMEDLLLSSVEKPYPNSIMSNKLAVCRNGDAIIYRIIKSAMGSSTRSIQRAKLSPKQIDEVKRLLAAPTSQFHSYSAEPNDKESFTNLVFFNGFEYKSHSFSGALPFKAQQLIDFVKIEIKKQQRTIYSK